MLRLVEEILRDAIARGQFDNLPGKGKPLDLSSYFSAPEDLRMGFSILKNAGYLPEEMELAREIDELEERRSTAKIEPERQALAALVREKRLRADLLREANQKKTRRG